MVERSLGTLMYVIGVSGAYDETLSVVTAFVCSGAMDAGIRRRGAVSRYTVSGQGMITNGAGSSFLTNPYLQAVFLR